jgi:uncharacterized membrane protein
MFYNAKFTFSFVSILIVAFIARFGLVFSFPNLSNDIYRFFWDGILMHQGIHPLSYLPSEIIGQGIIKSDEIGGLYSAMNSPDYFTIYPPISQLIFYVSTIFSPFSSTSSTILLKIVLLLSEIGCFYYLIKILDLLNMDRHRMLIYALNPLVIVEIMANVHFEGVMLFFLLGSIYYLLSHKTLVAGFFLGLSVATKLLPLMFLPVILLHLYKKKHRGLLCFIFSFVVISLILFVPFFYGLDVPHFLDSIDLYFRKFEFNASVYYVLREVGQLITGYNQISIIGPLLSLSALIIILFKAINHYRAESNRGTIINVMIFSFVTYLLCTTTVHPWYLIVPIGLSVFYKKYWLLVWSFFILLSYSTYQNEDFKQNLYLIAIEYIVVLIIWYIEKKNPNQNNLIRV